MIVRFVIVVPSHVVAALIFLLAAVVVVSPSGLNQEGIGACRLHDDGSSPLRILPLGDSLTSCTRVSRMFDSAQLSYRRWLWQLLTSPNRSSLQTDQQQLQELPLSPARRSGILVPSICCDASNATCSATHSRREGMANDSVLRPCTFVGTWVGCNKKLDASPFGLAVGASFPPRHDSYFGRTAANIAHAAPTLATSVTPTHVLLWAGINDFLLEGANVETVLSRLVRTASAFLETSSPVNLVLVGQLLPVHRKKSRIPRQKFEVLEMKRRMLNALLADETFCDNVTRNHLQCREASGATNSSSSSSSLPFTCRCLCAVVAFPLFNASRHTYDGIHPNDDGERYIAGQWHTSLAYHLRTPPPEEREVAGEHRELPNHPLIKIRTGEAALPIIPARDEAGRQREVAVTARSFPHTELGLFDHTVLIIVFLVSVCAFQMRRRGS